MPTFSGTSAIGLVDVVDYLFTASTWIAVDLKDNVEADRLTRIGLLIVSGQNNDGRFQVIEVFKLFGNGLFVLPRFPLTPLTYRVSIQFFTLTGDFDVIVP